MAERASASTGEWVGTRRREEGAGVTGEQTHCGEGRFLRPLGVPARSLQVRLTRTARPKTRMPVLLGVHFCGTWEPSREGVRTKEVRL